MKRWTIRPDQLALGMLGALALFVMLYQFVTRLTYPVFRYAMENGPIFFYGAAEGIMIFISVLVGAGFALFADFFVGRDTYRAYLNCTAVLTAIVLLCGYRLFWVTPDQGMLYRWKSVLPQLLETLFTLPALIAHFVVLYWLGKRKAA